MDREDQLWETDLERFEADDIVPSKFDRAKAIAALKQRFGIGERLIETYYHLYLYLNRTAIRERGLNQAEVESAVANEWMKRDGVNLAVSRSALASGNLPSGSNYPICPAQLSPPALGRYLRRLRYTAIYE